MSRRRAPLILAAPIALVSGLSRAARNGIIVKGAGAIETLGVTRTVLFDKTGTLAVGTRKSERLSPLNGLARGEVLRLAAVSSETEATGCSQAAGAGSPTDHRQARRPT